MITHIRGWTAAPGVLLCSLLLAACASSPGQREPATGVQHQPRVASAPILARKRHENFLADLIAAAAAMGGNNPNLTYRGLPTHSCPQRTRPPAETPSLAPCQRVAAK